MLAGHVDMSAVSGTHHGTASKARGPSWYSVRRLNGVSFCLARDTLLVLLEGSEHEGASGWHRISLTVTYDGQ
jgi:hypothetical protein